jgi:hypothetical protein
VELTCGRCGRSSFVPDDLVQGLAFRARCPDCQSLLEIPAERPNALDDKDLAWLSGEAKAREAEPAPPPPPRVTEQTVAQYERKAGAERRRHGVAIAAAALLAVAAAAGVLAAIAARTGAGPFSKRARQEPGPAAAATYDAGGLAERPLPEDPVPAAIPPPAPAPPAKKRTARISRNDRKLLDLLARKDDAAVVAPEGDAMDSAAAGIDAEAVARTVAANRKAFDACVSRALRLDPGLRVSKRATLVVTIQPNGSVTGAFIAEEDVDRTGLGGCLSAAARRMVFPAFDGEPTDVSLPLSLSAGF